MRAQLLDMQQNIIIWLFVLALFEIETITASPQLFPFLKRTNKLREQKPGIVYII